MKYKEWLKEWLEIYLKPTVKEKTYLNYSIAVDSHILPSLGEYELEELSLSTLQGFVCELKEHGNTRTGAGLSPNSIGVVVSVIQRSLNLAQEIGLVKQQYSHLIKRPKIEAKEAHYFTLAEQKKIEEEIFAHPDVKHIGILISLYSGLRIGELIALKWSDVDFEKRVINVNATCRDSYENGQLVKVIGTPKTQSSRRCIPIPRQLVPYLKKLKRRSSGEYVMMECGKHIGIRNYQKVFTNMIKRLGMKGKTFHSLRHTFATRALECGMDVKTLSEILGHKNPTVTLNRYAHSMMEHKITMMNRIGKFLQ